MDDVEPHPDDTDPSVDELADLQAGLLDDDAAARVRDRVRTDPADRQRLRALDRVRDRLAAAADEPAPEVPADVVSRVIAGLRSTPGHAVRQPIARRGRLLAAVAGTAAALAAAGLGTAALLHSPAPKAPATLNEITVGLAPSGPIPLSDSEILALQGRSPDYGALAGRVESCLSGLHYPDTVEVLGARPIEIGGRPGVLLLLPGAGPETLTALVVAAGCTSADHEVLAKTPITRP